jgi:hypothetical protein
MLDWIGRILQTYRHTKHTMRPRNYDIFKVIIFHLTLDDLSRQSGNAVSTPYRRPPNVLVLQHVSNYNISPMTHSYCASLWLPVLP